MNESFHFILLMKKDQGHFLSLNYQAKSSCVGPAEIPIERQGDLTKLFENGIHLITKIKKKMKNKLMLMSDKILLRKRAIIESVNNLLKNSCQIEHHRHRSR